MNQLKVGAFLSYLSILLTNIIALLYTPYMLRMMGQSEYGLYSLVASVVAYLTVLDLGFGNAIVRYTAQFRAKGKNQEQYEMFGMFFTLYVFIGIISFVIGLILCNNVENIFSTSMNLEEIRKVRIMMLLMALNIAVTFPLSLFGSIVTAYEDFVFQKIVNIIRIILNPLVMIIMLNMGYRAIGMVVVTTFFNLATLLVNTWYCFNHIKIKIYFSHFQWRFLKEVTIYSFWIFLNVIVDRIYWSTGQFILGVYHGSIVVAIYALAIQFQGIYMGFSSALTSVFLPKITMLVTQKADNIAISDIFIRVGRIQYIVMSFVLVGFILFGRDFIIFWAGKNYEESYYITLLFLIPLTIPLIQNLGITILQARNQMKFRALLYLVISVFSLLMSIPLAKRYGGIGCAIGVTIALITGQIIIMNIYYKVKIGIDIIRFWREIGQMSIIPILIGILSYMILLKISIQTPLELFVAIAVFSVCYAMLFWRFSLNSYERNLLSTFCTSL